MLVPDLSNDQIALLTGYRERILATNEHTNLTAIRDPEGIDFRLVLESMRLAPFVREAAGDKVEAVRLVDVGSGSGIPGIPLAVLFPNIKVAMIEATSKKATFIDETIRDLSLENASVIHGRSEEIARLPEWRESRQIATARAVGQIATLLELTMPLLKVGGRAIFPKGEIGRGERDGGERAAQMLGSRVVSIVELTPVGGCPATQVVLADKIAAMTDRYPRRPGLPARDPLGG